MLHGPTKIRLPLVQLSVKKNKGNEYVTCHTKATLMVELIHETL